MHFRKKILVADGAAALRMAVTAMLGLDYDVVGASDAHEAIEQALREEPDLVLLDFLLPPTGAFEVLGRLREHELTCCIPVIVATTRSGPEDLNACVAHGCRGYITKPLEACLLEELIEAVLRAPEGSRKMRRGAMGIVELVGRSCHGAALDVRVRGS